ncbi:uncharacterized protein LOC143280593 [Babylonia areolata]|uniref:uncharacterized protein LOC143280593 n=1 Tax=Babylonia areolata TaxID=304850 RepID=UPI003FD5A7BB
MDEAMEVDNRPPGSICANDYIKFISSDDHELIIHKKFCRHSQVIQNMIDVPEPYKPDGQRETPSRSDKPEELKCKTFSSYALWIMCTFLMFKTRCIDTGNVGDMQVTAQHALAVFEVADYFQI